MRVMHLLLEKLYYLVINIYSYFLYLTIILVSSGISVMRFTSDLSSYTWQTN